MQGDRNGQSYSIKDDPEVLDFFKENSDLPSAELAEKYLSNVSFHGQDLSKIEGLVKLVAEDLENIRNFGARKAMETLK